MFGKHRGVGMHFVLYFLNVVPFEINHWLYKEQVLRDHCVWMDLGLVGLNKGYIIIWLHVVTMKVQLIKT